jgi:hypothetical protein
MEGKLKVYLFSILLIGWTLFIILPYFNTNPFLPLYLPEFIMLGFIILLAFLTGKGLLFYLGFQQEVSLLFFLFATASGFGTIALFVLFIGQFKVLYPEVFLGLSFFVIFLSKSFLARLFYQIPTIRFIPLFNDVSCRPYWILFSLMIFVSLIHTLAPPIFFDTLVYHLGLPNLYIQDHRVSVYPYIVYSYYPLNTEMLYTFSLLLYKSPLLPGLLHFVMGVFTALSLYELARRFFNKRIGLLAVLIFYSTPLVMMLSTLAKNDLSLAYFEVSSLLGLLLWFEEGYKEVKPDQSREFSYFALSAILCGFAMGAKYTGGYFCVTLCLLVLFHTWSQKGAKSTTDWITRPILFALIAGSVVSPWLIRNLILTKNPFYPALTKVFGVGEFMRPEMREEDIVGFNPDPLTFINFPWDMTFHPFKFSSFSEIGPVFLIFLPFLIFLSLLFWIIRKRKHRKPPPHVSFHYLGWFVLLLFIFWTITLPYTRYYIGGIAVLSVLIAYIIVTLIEITKGTHGSFSPKYLIILIIGFALIHNVYLFVYREFMLFNPLPVSLRLKSMEDYLSSEVAYYPAAQFINKTLPSDVKILLLGETRSYYIERPMVLNTAFNKSIIVDLVSASQEISDLLTRLKNLGITHILFNSEEARRLQKAYTYFDFPGKREEDLYNTFVKNHLRPLFFKNEVYVFEVKY